MSKEYIDRNASLKAIDEIFSKTDQKSEEQIGVLKCRAAIREMEAADVAEVVHGEWIECDCCDPRDNWVKCNSCGYETTLSRNIKYGHCQNCGAKMDGGK